MIVRILLEKFNTFSLVESSFDEGAKNHEIFLFLVDLNGLLQFLHFRFLLFIELDDNVKLL